MHESIEPDSELRMSQSVKSIEASLGLYIVAIGKKRRAGARPTICPAYRVTVLPGLPRYNLPGLPRSKNSESVRLEEVCFPAAGERSVGDG